LHSLASKNLPDAHRSHPFSVNFTDPGGHTEPVMLHEVTPEYDILPGEHSVHIPLEANFPATQDEHAPSALRSFLKQISLNVAEGPTLLVVSLLKNSILFFFKEQKGGNVSA
jgi:hypothetical protein